MTLGSVYQSLWRSDDAYAKFSRVVELDPTHATALGQAVDAALSLARWDRYDELKDWLLRLADGPEATPEAERVLVFSLQAMPVAYETIARAARRSAAAMLPAGTTAARVFARRSAARPRVGFILPYTTWHSLPMVLKPVIEALDRERIEVWGYGTANGETTDFAKAYQAAFDRYTLVPGNKPDLAAERIAGDRVDILFDVSGHTSRTCLPVLAHRAAPVQVHGLGYSITTGASFVDYLLTDRHFMPPALARHNSEAGVFMPHSFMIAPPIERRPTPSRRVLGLAETAFVFSNFNHPCKFEPVVFAAWMRILKRAPNAVMWFGEFIEATAANLKREAERHGIDPARLVFAPKIQREDHCARLSAADMALDTYYHGGGITSVDALWAGVPLLSVAGETPAARMGATLLNAVGMPELLCRDLAEYEDRAVAFAGQPAAVAALRAKLAANVATAPLFDVHRYARDLATAFELMWRSHRDSRPVAPIEVPA
jgi:predicted O-linked N-acetylglucosamine transferase (SPINDLY family)